VKSTRESCDFCGNEVHGQLLVHAVDPSCDPDREGAQTYHLQFCTWACVAGWASAIHEDHAHVPVPVEECA
jgi:hypothetical protein